MKFGTMILAMLTLFIEAFQGNNRDDNKQSSFKTGKLVISCSIVRVNGNSFSFAYFSGDGGKIDSIKYFSEVEPSSCIEHDLVLKMREAFFVKFGNRPSRLAIINNSYSNHSFSLNKNGVGLVHLRNENFSATHGCSFKALLSSDTVYFNFESDRGREYEKMFSDFKAKHSSAFSKKVWQKIEEDFLRGKECY